MVTRLPRFLFAGVLAAAVIVAAGAARAAIFDPETFTLDNGMQVVVIPNHRAPIVTHMVWYRVGAADEPAGKSGLAHFLEHLMFKGTETLAPGEFSRIVARNGGRNNAFTSQDFTAYFQMIARDRLELVMRLEADRMQNLVLTDENVIPERDVILEERRMRVENNPSAVLAEAMTATLYYNHPYRTPIIGWAEEVRRLTTEDALAFYRRYYAPNNAILIVAGDVTARELRPLAEKYYGPIPPSDLPPRVRPPEPPHQTARRVTLESPRAGQPSWTRRYLAPSYTRGASEHAHALEVLAQVLGGNSISRLYRSLVVEQGLASSAGAHYDGDSYDLTEFTISATPREGVEIPELERAVEAEIRKVLEDGVDPEEVEDAKSRMQAQAIYVRDSLSAGARIFGVALTTGQTIEDVESWPERIGAVTPEEVEAAARAVLGAPQSVTGVLLPEPTS